jgi:hypothetical protein
MLIVIWLETGVKEVVVPTLVFFCNFSFCTRKKKDIKHRWKIGNESKVMAYPMTIVPMLSLILSLYLCLIRLGDQFLWP